MALVARRPAQKLPQANSAGGGYNYSAGGTAFNGNSNREGGRSGGGRKQKAVGYSDNKVGRVPCSQPMCHRNQQLSGACAAPAPALGRTLPAACHALPTHLAAVACLPACPPACLPWICLPCPALPCPALPRRSG